MNTLTENQKFRISICKSCDKFVEDKFLQAMSICSECKCLVYPKILLKKPTCPLNKWKEDE